VAQVRAALFGANLGYERSSFVSGCASLAPALGSAVFGTAEAVPFHEVPQAAIVPFSGGWLFCLGVVV